MTRYVAYYRVSTDKQGKSGLGLDAQRQAVGSFVAGRGEIVAEHTEMRARGITGPSSKLRSICAASAEPPCSLPA